MPNAADLRYQGRMALKSHWAEAICLTILAALLGGIGNVSIMDTFDSILESEWLMDSAFGLWIYRTLPFLVVEYPIFSIPINIDAVYRVTININAINIVHLILGGAIQLGVCLYFCKLHRGMDARFTDLFTRFTHFGKALGLYLLIMLKTFLWGLLFVIPGIIASYRYAMAPYLMAENPQLGINEAIEMSCYMMQGDKGKLFCLHLSFFGWAFLSALTLGIGYIFLCPYVFSAESAFFLQLLARKSPYRQTDSQQAYQHNGQAYGQQEEPHNNNDQWDYQRDYRYQQPEQQSTQGAPEDFYENYQSPRFEQNTDYDGHTRQE